MTKEEKIIQEFVGEFIEAGRFSDDGVSYGRDDSWINHAQLGIIRKTLRKALKAKEEEVLKKVAKCVPDENSVIFKEDFFGLDVSVALERARKTGYNDALSHFKESLKSAGLNINKYLE